MKTIVTTLGSFTTGTEIADAVTAYGLALARVQRVDVVDIPYVASDGALSRVEMRIGWLTETAALSSEDAYEDPFEIDTILDIRAKARDLHSDPATLTFRPAFSERGEWQDHNWDDLI